MGHRGSWLFYDRATCHLGSSSTDCAPFKTRSLRFEWETTILTLPLIAKKAMNGAQLRITHRGFDDLGHLPNRSRMSEKILPPGRSGEVFLLDIPFYRTRPINQL